MLRGGRLQQVAAPRDLYERPANIFVAGFIGSPGMNIVRSPLEAGEEGLCIRLGETWLALPTQVRASYPSLDHWIGRELLVGIRPEAITVAADTATDALPGQVRAAESLGHETVLFFTAEVSSAVTDNLDPNTTDVEPPPLAAILPGHHPLRANDWLRLRIDTGSLHFFTPNGAAMC